MKLTQSQLTMIWIASVNKPCQKDIQTFCQLTEMSPSDVLFQVNSLQFLISNPMMSIVKSVKFMVLSLDRQSHGDDLDDLVCSLVRVISDSAKALGFLDDSKVQSQWKYMTNR